jgi:hypothetical protein
MVDQATTEALPKGAVITRIGGQYRIVWNLGDGLGYAWYSISDESLKNIYDTATPDMDDRFVFDNVGQFTRRFGDFYWGNIEEVSLKAETPWQDLTEKIEGQFGHVPGLNTDEIRRLLRQAYFEGWDQNTWTVHYRDTQYYKSRTDDQRAWVGLSESEKQQRVDETARKMADRYRYYWGIDKPWQEFKDAALKVASGEITMDTWESDTERSARGTEGSPAWADFQQRQRAGKEEQNLAENWEAFAEDEWRSWVGPVDMPGDFGARWGAWLASGEKSEADLENYLKSISQGRWSYKPPDLAWKDWAASYKSQIRDELELPSLDDKDPLLNKILNSDLTGQDLTQMIRQDDRFLSTRNMYGQLSSAVADMGRRFGFIT